ncbi:MAG: sensor domain-containing diguanylate cyclase [Endomicrobium sp.]|jgi:diguanylate cyclase (GGDEF)-like protein|nr:sensor domain-containing diguanylate cyclase [Endomicrobium sp.]
MIKQKVSKDILDIISNVGLPILAGVFFVVWIINLLVHPVINFPLIAIPIIVLYYFSGNIYSGIITVFAVVTGTLDITFFIEQKSEVILVFLEAIAVVCLYLILEMYKNKYVSIKNRFFEEYETLDREITLECSEISKNKKRIEYLTQYIKFFKKIGRTLQSFQTSLSEKEIIEKSEYIAYKFMGKGTWELKKYSDNNVFAFYVRKTSLPLLITDMSSDERFPSGQKYKQMSLIAFPIEFNRIFWGILQGTSYVKNFFSEEDLRHLSLLSGTISTVLNNSYLYKELQTLAVTDGLTGLFTHNYFKERLKGEISRSNSNKLSLSLGLLDIDFFKDINDKYGHQAGDSILHQISLLLRARLRETDFIARYGGEEFAFIMLNTNSREAAKILEQIRLTIEQERFFLPVESLTPVRVKITSSIGFVSLDKNCFISEEEFIKNADAALYKAKHSGRNKVEEFLNEK